MLSEQTIHQIAQFLISITEGAESESMKAYFYKRYSEVITRYITTDDFSAGGKSASQVTLNDNESFMVGQVVRIAEMYHNYPDETITSDKLRSILNRNIRTFTDTININPWILNNISFEKYENKSLTSSFIALSLSENNPDCWLPIDPDHQYKLSAENRHGIRKLLEMLSENQCLVFGNVKGQYCVKGIDRIDNPCFGIIIEFPSPGEWIMSKRDYNTGKFVKIIYCKNGDYRIDRSLDIKSILKTHCIDNLIRDNQAFDSVVKSIDTLLKLNKGAILCFLDDKNDFDKLTQFKRAFKLENTTYDANAIKAFASIDGAIICDFSGNFLGFGAILDGDANTDADLQRGSRYNSTLNFIRKKDIHNAFGIVVSDDGMIDVIVQKEQIL